MNSVEISAKTREEAVEQALQQLDASISDVDIEVLDEGDISLMCIKGFLSYDEAHAYAQQLYTDRHMATVLQGIRTLLISDTNLALLGKAFSFDDYKDFFDNRFAPLQLPKNFQIDEPTDIEVRDPDDVDEDAGTSTEDTDDYEDFPYGF